MVVCAAGADDPAAGPRRRGMPICKSCGEDADTLVSVKVAGKAKKLCEDCADRAREEAEVAEASESVVQNMMGFKGRR
jgi:ribosome-binding protein aMBF1 (putative translation factor)